MSTLYQLTDDVMKIIEMLGEEEYKNYAESLITTLEGLEYEIEQKGINYAKVIKNIEFKISSIDGQIEYLKKTTKTLDDKKKAMQNTIKRLKDSLLVAMEVVGIPKIKNEEFNIYPTTSSKVIIKDLEEAFKNNFAEIEYKPNKTAIKKAIKLGENIEFAEIEESKALIIR